MDTAIAVLAALLSAVCFGVSSVVQQHAASEAPAKESLRLGLVLHLARRPVWLAGMALTGLSFVMQGLALTFGPLVLVQPIAATDLAFALPLLARLHGEHLNRWEVAGIACTAGGVVTFLTVLPPASSGTTVPGLLDWLPVLVVAGGAVALFASVGSRSGHRAQTTLYGVSAALLFALLDSLTKSVAGRARADGFGVLFHWEPYVLIVVGIVGLVLSQSAFQAGSLAISLPVIDTLEPIGAVLIGVVVFNERLASSPGAVLVQAVGAGVAVTGIVILARSRLARA
ncbi:DMT family transporter [Streptomyces sp. NBC_01476]|uniref:DMT family transporter n=1 Tax=Streptomyces sp. NBC_01476 TaxID=2903881 RepID=UPI002E2F10ED|nr:DMT family transporter [Streptomyces sp. NBC_01476]